MEQEYRKIAHIQDAYALKGEMKIVILTNNYDFFRKGQEVFLKKDDNYIREEIEEFRIMPKAAVLKLKGISSIDGLNDYLKCDLFVIKGELKNKVYLEDFIGAEVQDKNGKSLGKVEDFYTTGLQSYLQINGNLVPYIVDTMIVSYDKDKNILVLSDLGKDILENA